MAQEAKNCILQEKAIKQTLGAGYFLKSLQNWNEFKDII